MCAHLASTLYYSDNYLSIPQRTTSPNAMSPGESTTCHKYHTNDRIAKTHHCNTVSLITSTSAHTTVFNPEFHTCRWRQKVGASKVQTPGYISTKPTGFLVKPSKNWHETIQFQFVIMPVTLKDFFMF